MSERGRDNTDIKNLVKKGAFEPAVALCIWLVIQWDPLELVMSMWIVNY